jgi:putative hydrolase of the HAD superfamily
MKNVIIFDVMGVIFTVSDDTNDLLIPYIQTLKPQIKKETVKQLYLDASLGNISAHEFWAELEFPSRDIDKIQKDYLDTHLTLDKGFIECVKTLKSKYIIALLSNDVSEWSGYLRKRHRINEYIDYAFISSDLHLRKPDPEIYKQALNRMNAKPSECVFIDDDPRRVDAAAELGIASILFNRNNDSYKGIQVRSFKELSDIL